MRIKIAAALLFLPTFSAIALYGGNSLDTTQALALFDDAIGNIEATPLMDSAEVVKRYKEFGEARIQLMKSINPDLWERLWFIAHQSYYPIANRSTFQFGMRKTNENWEVNRPMLFRWPFSLAGAVLSPLGGIKETFFKKSLRQETTHVLQQYYDIFAGIKNRQTLDLSDWRLWQKRISFLEKTMGEPKDRAKLPPLLQPSLCTQKKFLELNLNKVFEFGSDEISRVKKNIIETILTSDRMHTEPIWVSGGGLSEQVYEEPDIVIGVDEIKALAAILKHPPETDEKAHVELVFTVIAFLYALPGPYQSVISDYHTLSAAWIISFVLGMV